MAECVLCGAAATRMLHGVPLWVPEAVGLDDAPLERGTAVAPPEGDDLPQRSLPASIPPHPAYEGEWLQQTRIETLVDTEAGHDWRSYGEVLLCEECAEVTQGLEDRARPLVEPLIRGESGTVPPDRRRDVAIWSAWIGYRVLAVEGRGEGVPEGHRETFRQTGEPHQHVLVCFGRSKQVGILTVAGLMELELERDGEGAGTVDAYAAIAVLGELVVKVFGVREPPEPHWLRIPHGGRAQYVWPDDGEGIDWPPLHRLDEPGLESLFRFNHLRLGTLRGRH